MSFFNDKNLLIRDKIHPLLTSDGINLASNTEPSKTAIKLSPADFNDFFISAIIMSI